MQFIEYFRDYGLAPKIFSGAVFVVDLTRF